MIHAFMFALALVLAAIAVAMMIIDRRSTLARARAHRAEVDARHMRQSQRGGQP